MVKPTPTHGLSPMQKKIVEFMSRAHSVSEITSKFGKKYDLSQVDVREMLKAGFPGFDLVEGPRNVKGNRTYMAMVAIDIGELPKQEWSCPLRSSQPEQPYFEIQLPDVPSVKKLRIILFDNVGFGAPDHDAKLFHRVIREAQKPNTFCAFNGDIIAPIQNERRGKAEERDRAFQDRIGAFMRTIKPVLHKVMWAQQGCLEREAEKKLGVDPMRYICGKFGIPYYAQPVYVDLYWRENLFTLQVAHGHSTSQTKGGRENSGERFASLTGATDFVARGHIGDAMSREKPMIVRDNSVPSLIAREQYMLVLGGFRKYWGSSAAIKGQTPTSGDSFGLILYPDGGRAIKTIHEKERKGASNDE